ncbi:MAG TPA: MaoC family dehydratase N-terminal domain-containing protein [bacterium]|nr:MaoC family dehydratase N-terminal domain-containing protein [bacterium]
MPDLADWVGRARIEQDLITLTRARSAAGLFDEDPERVVPGTELPACWHWFYFNPVVRRSELGEDGHPKRGTFLPPVVLPRRMWAGGRLRFRAPIRVGESAERRSEIASVQEKEGRSGKMVLVTVRHRVSSRDGLGVEEDQDLIYREATKFSEQPRSAAPSPEAQWEDAFSPDTTALFSFSALTGNGHRIHYDQEYAKQVEGYPGLLVHGPLTALLLLQAAQRRAGLRPTAYTYRAVAPLFVGEPITLAGVTRADHSTEVWARGPRGVAMQGTIEW